MKQFIVVYRVKYSELWCADECQWVEEVMVCSALNKKGARQAYRNDVRQRRTRVMLGRHISTRLITKDERR